MRGGPYGDTLHGGPGADYFYASDADPPGGEDWIAGNDGYDILAEHGDEDHIGSDIEEVW